MTRHTVVYTRARATFEKHEILTCTIVYASKSLCKHFLCYSKTRLPRFLIPKSLKHTIFKVSNKQTWMHWIKECLYVCIFEFEHAFSSLKCLNHGLSNEIIFFLKFCCSTHLPRFCLVWHFGENMLLQTSAR